MIFKDTKALYYNENSEREQAEGTLRYNIAYLKNKKGEHVIKKASEQQTFSMLRWYVQSLPMHSKLFSYVKEMRALKAPPLLVKIFEKPEKAEAIIQHKSRFSHLK